MRVPYSGAWLSENLNFFHFIRKMLLYKKKFLLGLIQDAFLTCYEVSCLKIWLFACWAKFPRRGWCMDSIHLAQLETNSLNILPPILGDQGCAAGDENQPCPVQIENCITLRGAAPEVKHIPSHPLLVWTWIQTFTLTEISSACLLLYCFIVLREVAVNLYSIYKLRWEKYFGPICWIVCGWRLVSKLKTGLDSNRTTRLEWLAILWKSQKIWNYANMHAYCPS